MTLVGPITLSMSATACARLDSMPLGSPTVNARRDAALVRIGFAGSYMPAPSVMTQPSTLLHPAIGLSARR